MVDSSIKSDEYERRLEAIARLRLRGYTIRQMVEVLPRLKPPVLNKKGGHLTKSSIGDAVTELTRRWREAALKNIEDHMSAEYAELREVKRLAWKEGDLELVLKAHDRIARLMGMGKNGVDINVDVLQNSFQVGEIGPETHARVMKVLEQYHHQLEFEPKDGEGD